LVQEPLISDSTYFVDLYNFFCGSLCVVGDLFQFSFVILPLQEVPVLSMYSEIEKSYAFNSQVQLVFLEQSCFRYPLFEMSFRHQNTLLNLILSMD